MAMTQLQKLELNKRVDKIFHAPSNAPAGNHQPEIAFVTPMSGDLECIQSSIKDAVASLKHMTKCFRICAAIWYIGALIKLLQK